MKNALIKLNSTVSIDLQKLVETRLLVQANSGGGKSWAIRRIIEQSFGKVQIIVLDPEGEFTNLRTKFDFVYAGKGGDAPVESRSATLLAHRLLELKASAIIDLYELQPQERKHFVRLFCSAMVDAPKELWHEVIVIIDEAHVFAPEKGESEAMGAVIDLATRGRKRGYCVVLATQRLPKLNKDAAAECNNKLIGRASQDIDRKRAAEELGFTGKEEVRSLRDLDPGEFYAFGPAISREVIKVRIGDVAVKPPLRGTARALKTPPPSSKVRQILAKLKDLPQEAAQEAKTTKELKDALATAHRQIGALERTSRARMAGRHEPDPDVVERVVNASLQRRDAEWMKLIDKWDAWAADVINFVCLTEQAAKKMYEKRGNRPPYKPEGAIGPAGKVYITAPAGEEMKRGTAVQIKPDGRAYSAVSPSEDKTLGKGEREILNAIAQHEEGITTEHIAVLTGYKQTSRRVYLQRLTAGGYATQSNGVYTATQEGIDALGDGFRPLPTSGLALREHFMQTLPEGEKKVLSAIMMGNDDTTQGVSREYIEHETGYKTTSVRVYVQRLTARKAIETVGGLVRLTEKLQ